MSLASPSRRSSSRSDERRQSILLSAFGVFASTAVCRGGLQGRHLLLELTRQLLLLSCNPRSLAVQLFRIAYHEEVSWFVLSLPHPLPGNGERGGDPLP